MTQEKSIYDHTRIEPKYREKWFKHNLYQARDFDAKPKKYILCEFPYPSGAALHAGHMMRFTVPEIYSRWLRMNGYNVMFPIGWDAFGLPAENFAIKTGVHPAETTKNAITNYKESICKMGYAIDWNREINTTDSKYYKWTQWLFLKFWENGLAEYKEMPIWWCEQLKTVLSDEEVLTDKNGNKISERGEYPVERRMIKQWVLKITKYADKLIEGLNLVDFPKAIKYAQINWIGRKEGINIHYKVDTGEKNQEIVCFTTRPDTNFGATFIVLAPEHPFVTKIIEDGKTARKDAGENYMKIKNYVGKAKTKSELERMSEGRKKTGVFTGFYAINNLNNKKLPIWISDFVLAGFGTGAVIGVPGHDKRDFEFAKEFNLEILRVVVGKDADTSPITDIKQVQEDEGTMINSDFLDKMEIHTAKQKIMDYIEQKGWGEKAVIYSLRDWVFSRQRYWGEPIPLIHKQDGTIEALCDTKNTREVEKTLPLTLPEVPDYNPTSDGTSPLAKNKNWTETKDKSGNPAARETNTMPNWAGSSWYYLRYIDPNNDKEFADQKKLKYWLPVDRYFGGSEHTTMHLLYSRFWHKFFYDLKLVPTPEPYAWRINGGVLLGPDGSKMSKSKGNVIEPMDAVDNYGADALRMYICFLGPYEDTYPWNENGIKSCYRLVKNAYELKDKISTDDKSGNTQDLVKTLHKTIKKVSEMIEKLKMNTAVSEFMIFMNETKNYEEINLELYGDLIKLIAPFAPFMAEEAWQEINHYAEWKKENSVHVQPWPKYDESLIKDETIKIPVQINGKVRDEVEINVDDGSEVVKQKVLSGEKVKKIIGEASIKKFIYVREKIVNLVI